MRLLKDGEQAAWTALLRFLEIRFVGESLPQRVSCPACRVDDALCIFDDEAGRTQWHSCAACGICGDLLDLAGRVWSLSPENVLKRLKTLGLTEEDEESDLGKAYLAQRERQRAVLKAVRAAETLSDRYWAAGGCTSLISLGVRSRMTPELWKSRIAPALGVVPATKIEEAFAAKIFRGPKWAEVVSIPFWSLPGKLSGLALIGRDASPDSRIWKRAPGTAADGDFGLAGLGFSWINRLALNRWAIGVDDPTIYAILQVRQARVYPQPLPLVLWHDSVAGRTRPGSWRATGRRPLLWLSRFGWRELRQAVELDAHVAMVPRSDKRNATFERQDPANQLAYVVQRARPWRQALKEHLAWASAEEVDALLSPLIDRTNEAWTDQVLVLPRVQDLLRARVTWRCVVWRGVRWYEDEGGGWRTAKKSWTDFIVRLDEVRIAGEVGTVHGRVLVEGTESRFELPLETLQRKPKAAFETIARTALLAGQGIIETQLPAAQLFELARKFKPWRTVYQNA